MWLKKSLSVVKMWPINLIWDILLLTRHLFLIPQEWCVVLCSTIVGQHEENPGDFNLVQKPRILKLSLVILKLLLDQGLTRIVRSKIFQNIFMGQILTTFLSSCSSKQKISKLQIEELLMLIKVSYLLSGTF